MQANAATVTGFSAHAYPGATIQAITGTLRNFSGGKLNWTVEARCSDDLVFCKPSDADCLANPPAPKASKDACVERRTEYDPDEDTN